MTAESDLGESRMTNAIMGAAQLLEELAVQFDILDRTMPLYQYKLVILPDDFEIDEEFAGKLGAFVRVFGDSRHHCTIRAVHKAIKQTKQHKQEGGQRRLHRAGR